MENMTEVTQFILLGMTNVVKLQVPLLIIFILIYFINVAGNLGMILLVLLDAHLHSPMYFFLSNLSLVDFCYSSAVIPTVMAGLLKGDKIISYNACAAQMFFFAAFATMENFLLAPMAYDRYAAVCKPLHYTTTMTTSLCICLATGSYVCGFLNASIHTGVTFSLSFCAAHDESQMTLMENISEVTEFLLIGLTDALKMQVPLFTIFTLTYLVTLIGNLGMIVLILLDS
ncbi:olfactory receptor 5B2-like protein [Camelus ferus]|nr:olfactory receptor 5B2-like protein [Camelus ferus]